jgi:hypothetical protein
LLYRRRGLNISPRFSPHVSPPLSPLLSPGTYPSSSAAGPIVSTDPRARNGRLRANGGGNCYLRVSPSPTTRTLKREPNWQRATQAPWKSCLPASISVHRPSRRLVSSRIAARVEVDSAAGFLPALRRCARCQPGPLATPGAAAAIKTGPRPARGSRRPTGNSRSARGKAIANAVRLQCGFDFSPSNQGATSFSRACVHSPTYQTAADLNGLSLFSAIVFTHTYLSSTLTA